MSLSHIFQRFAQGTTMHGISRAIQARSAVTRAFWLTVLGIAAATFFYQFAHLLLKYFSYPKKVTVEVSNTPVPFPSVSLCNMRHLDNMVLDEISRVFLVNEEPEEWKNATNNPYVSAYIDSVRTYANIYYSGPIDDQVFETISSWVAQCTLQWKEHSTVGPSKNLSVHILSLGLFLQDIEGCGLVDLCFCYSPVVEILQIKENSIRSKFWNKSRLRQKWLNPQAETDCQFLLSLFPQQEQLMR